MRKVERIRATDPTADRIADRMDAASYMYAALE